MVPQLPCKTLSNISDFRPSTPFVRVFTGGPLYSVCGPLFMPSIVFHPCYVRSRSIAYRPSRPHLRSVGTRETKVSSDPARPLPETPIASLRPPMGSKLECEQRRNRWMRLYGSPACARARMAARLVAISQVLDGLLGRSSCGWHRLEHSLRRPRRTR